MKFPTRDLVSIAAVICLVPATQAAEAAPHYQYAVAYNRLGRNNCKSQDKEDGDASSQML